MASICDRRNSQQVVLITKCLSDFAEMSGCKQSACFVQRTVTYDWRLAVPNLEIRDFYFSRLKAAIEEYRRNHGKKVLLRQSLFKAFSKHFLDAGEYGRVAATHFDEYHMEGIALS